MNTQSVAKRRIAYGEQNFTSIRSRTLGDAAITVLSSKVILSQHQQQVLDDRSTKLNVSRQAASASVREASGQETRSIKSDVRSAWTYFKPSGYDLIRQSVLDNQGGTEEQQKQRAKKYSTGYTIDLLEKFLRLKNLGITGSAILMSSSFLKHCHRQWEFTKAWNS